MPSSSSDMEDDVREFLTRRLEVHIMVKDQAYSEAVRPYLSEQAA